MRSHLMRSLVAFQKGRRRIVHVHGQNAFKRPQDPDAEFRRAKVALARSGLQGKSKPIRFVDGRLGMKSISSRKVGRIAVSLDAIEHIASRHTGSHDRPSWRGFDRAKARKPSRQELSSLRDPTASTKNRIVLQWKRSLAVLEQGGRGKGRKRIVTAFKPDGRFKKAGAGAGSRTRRERRIAALAASARLLRRT